MGWWGNAKRKEFDFHNFKLSFMHFVMIIILQEPDEFGGLWNDAVGLLEGRALGPCRISPEHENVAI